MATTSAMTGSLMVRPSQLGAKGGVPGHHGEAAETEGKKDEIEHDGALLFIDRSSMRAIDIKSRCGTSSRNIKTL
jgi:hypothetical protein